MVLLCRLVCIHGRERSALSVLAMCRVQMDASSSDSSSPSANGRETNANDDGCGQPIASVLPSFFPSLPTIYTLLSHLPCLSVPASLPPSLLPFLPLCLSVHLYDHPSLVLYFSFAPESTFLVISSSVSSFPLSLLHYLFLVSCTSDSHSL